MNTPTPKVITEIIDKLSGLQAELRRIRDVANYGEDPETAKAEAEKAQDCLRHILDNPPARRKWTAKELEDLRTRVLGKNAPLPTHLDMYLVVMEGLAAVVRSLPIHHLAALKATVSLRTAFRDEEEIAAGFTIGALKSTVAVVLADRELAMSKDMLDARTRVYREVEEILCPYEEFLKANQPGADKGLASLTGPILSVDVEQFDWAIHPFRKIRSRLEVEVEIGATQGLPPQSEKTGSRKRSAGDKAHLDGVQKAAGPSPSETRAWQSYQWVGENRRDLMPKNGEPGLYTREMYEAAIDESPHYTDDDNEQIAKPGFDSWKRYLRGYIQKAPRQADTRPDIRSEEIADRHNTQDLAHVTNRFQPWQKKRAD